MTTENVYKLLDDLLEARIWARKYKRLYDDAEDRVKVLVALIEVRQDAQAEEIERLRAALEEIAKAEGVFSTDPLTHAENCIKHMVLTALDALDGE